MRLLKLFVFSAMFFASQAATSATWFAFTDVGTDDKYYFFDFDTITKDRDITNIWIKTVRKVTVDKEGAWAVATK